MPSIENQPESITLSTQLVYSSQSAKTMTELGESPSSVIVLADYVLHSSHIVVFTMSCILEALRPVRL